MRTAGLVIVRQRPATAKDFAFLRLEGEAGRVDVTVAPKLFERERETINRNCILAVVGRLGVEDGVVNLRAERFYLLRKTHARWWRGTTSIEESLPWRL